MKQTGAKGRSMILRFVVALLGGLLVSAIAVLVVAAIPTSFGKIVTPVGLVVATLLGCVAAVLILRSTRSTEGSESTGEA
jgi:uncharacterized membrane protein